MTNIACKRANKPTLWRHTDYRRGDDRRRDTTRLVVHRVLKIMLGSLVCVAAPQTIRTMLTISFSQGSDEISNETLWNALCHKYYNGVDSVRWMQRTWSSLSGKIDADRQEQVRMLLTMQEKEAVIWRNSCVLYFQTFSKRPIPSALEKPTETLDYYQELQFPFAPGIRPKW